MPWHTKATGGYARTSQDAYDNAKMIYDILAYCGWHLPAVCACLGNCEVESGYNPWRWQSDSVLPVGDPRIYYQNSHAYGLYQQDPASKYIDSVYAQGVVGYGPNYSDQAGNTYDGSAQTFYLNHVCSDPDSGEWGDYWGSPYYLPFSDFIVDEQHSIDFLTETFRVGYERGEASPIRAQAANYWWGVFQGTPPEPPPDPPEPPGPQPPVKTYPYWLLWQIAISKRDRKYVLPKSEVKYCK